MVRISDSEVSLGECAALVMWMTWKCALLRLPCGGAKGGVRCSPRELSQNELQKITRRFTSELLPIIGPQKDIPAPDMATNEQTMAWMMDTYSMEIGRGLDVEALRRFAEEDGSLEERQTERIALDGDFNWPAGTGREEKQGGSYRRSSW